EVARVLAANGVFVTEQVLDDYDEFHDALSIPRPTGPAREWTFGLATAHDPAAGLLAARGEELDPRRAADARDVEARRRQRRHERTVRISLAVEVAGVDERDVARQSVHVPQELRHGHGKAQIHEGLGDLAVADAERAVARHPRDHALARMDDAEVVQTRDVEAVADQLDELGRRLRVSAGNGQGTRQRAPVVEILREGVSRRRGAVARASRRRAVPDDPARDPVRHELDAPLRRAFEVEGLGKPAGVQSVVGDGNALVEDTLAESTGKETALLEQPERSERVV